MKKYVIALAAAFLLVGAGCENSPLLKDALQSASGTQQEERGENPSKDKSDSEVKKDEDRAAGTNEDRDKDEDGDKEDEGDDDNKGTVTPPTTPAPTPAPGTAVKSYTLAEIALHKDSKSCWTAINGSVYDVTGWISQHPGGSGPILSLCGKDGSPAFDNQHGGQARPASELAGFKIGTLKK